MSQKWFFRAVIVGLALVVAVGLSINNGSQATATEAETKTQPSGPPPAPVRVAPAQQQMAGQSLWVPASIVSRNDARLAAEIPGRLEWVAEIGDQIKQGEPVARIDARALRLRLKRDEASIRRLEVNSRYLDTQLTRLQSLNEQQIASRDQLDEITARKEVADQELVEARLARDETQFLLSRTRILAPFPGKVVERLKKPGEYIAVGGEAVRLVDILHTEARAQAPLEIAPYLQDGMPVHILDGDEEIETHIRTVVPVGDERSRMFEVRVDLPNHRTWAVGAAARVGLPSSQTQTAVTIPRDALILRRNNTYVFRVNAQNTVEQVQVEAGAGKGPSIAVRGDISAGDRVVVRGGERLQPGQSVTIQVEPGE